MKNPARHRRPTRSEKFQWNLYRSRRNLDRLNQLQLHRGEYRFVHRQGRKISSRVKIEPGHTFRFRIQSFVSTGGGARVPVTTSTMYPYCNAVFVDQRPAYEQGRWTWQKEREDRERFGSFKPFAKKYLFAYMYGGLGVGKSFGIPSISMGRNVGKTALGRAIAKIRTSTAKAVQAYAQSLQQLQQSLHSAAGSGMKAHAALTSLQSAMSLTSYPSPVLFSLMLRPGESADFVGRPKSAWTRVTNDEKTRIINVRYNRFRDQFDVSPADAVWSVTQGSPSGPGWAIQTKPPKTTINVAQGLYPEDALRVQEELTDRSHTPDVAGYIYGYRIWKLSDEPVTDWGPWGPFESLNALTAEEIDELYESDDPEAAKIVLQAPVLRSWGISEQFWRPGINVAQCTRGGHEAAVPGLLCHCGYWGLTDEGLPAVGGLPHEPSWWTNNLLWGHASAVIAGKIRGSGKVVETGPDDYEYLHASGLRLQGGDQHPEQKEKLEKEEETWGFRAEKAEIVELYCNGLCQRLSYSSPLSFETKRELLRGVARNYGVPIVHTPHLPILGDNGKHVPFD